MDNKLNLKEYLTTIGEPNRLAILSFLKDGEKMRLLNLFIIFVLIVGLSLFMSGCVFSSQPKEPKKNLTDTQRSIPQRDLPPRMPE